MVKMYSCAGAVTAVTINDPLAQKPVYNAQSQVVDWEQAHTGTNFRVPGDYFLVAMKSVNPNLDHASAVAVMPGRKP